MLGVELVKPGGKEPNAAAAAAIMEETRARGLLVGEGGLYGNVAASPPMTITADEIAEGVDILEASLNAIPA